MKRLGARLFKGVGLLLQGSGVQWTSLASGNGLDMSQGPSGATSRCVAPRPRQGLLKLRSICLLSGAPGTQDWHSHEQSSWRTLSTLVSYQYYHSRSAHSKLPWASIYKAEGFGLVQMELSAPAGCSLWAEGPGRTVGNPDVPACRLLGKEAVCPSPTPQATPHTSAQVG